jgi:hypothetical protein
VLVGNKPKVMTKLVAILVAPVALLLVLAFVGVRSRQAEADEAGRALALTRLVGAATSLLSEVEGEALQAARYSGSEGSPEIRTRYEQQQQATNAATEEVRRQIQAIDPATWDPRVKTAVTDLTDRLDALPAHRALVVQRSTDGLRANEPYGQITDSLTDTMRQINDSLDDPLLFQRMSSATGVAALGAARSHTANLVALAVEVGYYPAQLPKQGETASKTLNYGEGCGDRPAEAEANSCRIYEQINEARHEVDTASERFQAVGSADDVPTVRALSDDSPLNDIIATAYEQGGRTNDLTLGAIGVARAELADAADRAIDGYDASVRHILLDADNADSVLSIAQAEADRADQAARSYLVATVLALLVAAIVTYFVGRSITKALPREPSALGSTAP